MNMGGQSLGGYGPPKPIVMPGSMGKTGMTTTANEFSYPLSLGEQKAQTQSSYRETNPHRYGASTTKAKELPYELDPMGASFAAPARTANSSSPTFRFFKRNVYDEVNDTLKNRHGTRGCVYYRPQSIENERLTATMTTKKPNQTGFW
jgi:hypothetical protein